MPNRNDRNPYARSRMDNRHSAYGPTNYRQGSGGVRFRWNAVNLALIAVVLVVGTIIGIALLSKGRPGGTNGGTRSGTTQQTDTPASADSAAGAQPSAGTTAAPDESPAATIPAGTDASPVDSIAPSSGFFTSGDPQIDDTTYKSSDLYVKVSNVNENGINYYVADCRMKSSDKLFTALAGDKYALHTAETTSDIAMRKGAVIAINGDYYGFRAQGIVIRNGTLYRKTPYFDVAAIFNDGTMKTYKNSETTADKLLSGGAVQAFGFGPLMLDGDGHALANAQFSEPHNRPANPRSGIGYIEPNHFVLVIVDGRGAGGSAGMTQVQFAKVFEGLGCKCAYNLDGGGSATMVFMGKVINHPCDTVGERPVSDIVYFGESETDQANIGRMNQQ